MRVKLLNEAAAAGLLDPNTKRSPFIDPTTGKVLAEADVPETSHWVRRLLDGDIERVIDDPKPSGREPVAPLTKR